MTNAQKAEARYLFCEALWTEQEIADHYRMPVEEVQAWSSYDDEDDDKPQPQPGKGIRGWWAAMTPEERRQRTDRMRAGRAAMREAAYEAALTAERATT